MAQAFQALEKKKKNKNGKNIFSPIDIAYHGLISPDFSDLIFTFR